MCLAGGVAFNCVANGKIFDHTPFSEVYVQPAAGDAGLSVGAAYYVYHQILGQPRTFVMDHAYWGPQFTPEAIAQALENSRVRGLGSPVRKLSDDELMRLTAQHLADGKIVGWYQGRQEWGPRALGNRSILVDPRRAEMKDILNQRIKHREPFRPFAPSILEEATGQFFERSHPSPFMNLAYAVRPEKRAVIPAPTHVDGTGRLQTVSRQTNPRYWALIKEFEKLTGVPVLLNTSFNENEPIVLTPKEAIDCFLRTRMDVLVLGNYLIEKPPLAPSPGAVAAGEPEGLIRVSSQSTQTAIGSLTTGAHSSPQRVFSPGHCGDCLHGGGGGGCAGRAPFCHRALRSAFLRSHRSGTRFTFFGVTVAASVVVERVGSTTFPRFRMRQRIWNYLSYVALVHSARPYDTHRFGHGHDRPAVPGHCGRFCGLA